MSPTASCNHNKMDVDDYENDFVLINFRRFYPLLCIWRDLKSLNISVTLIWPSDYVFESFFDCECQRNFICKKYWGLHLTIIYEYIEVIKYHCPSMGNSKTYQNIIFFPLF